MGRNGRDECVGRGGVRGGLCWEETGVENKDGCKRRMGGEGMV